MTGLIGTSVISTSGGRILSDSLNAPRPVPMQFVPGAPSQFKAFAQWSQNKQDALIKVTKLESRPNQPVVGEEYPWTIAGPRRPNEWCEFITESLITTLDSPTASLATLFVQYDCPSGTASCDFSVSRDGAHWFHLTSNLNYFGGLHMRCIQASLPLAILGIGEPIRFRVRMKATAGIFNGESFPVALRINTSNNPNGTVCLELWNRKENVGGANV